MYWEILPRGQDFVTHSLRRISGTPPCAKNIGNALAMMQISTTMLTIAGTQNTKIFVVQIRPNLNNNYKTRPNSNSFDVKSKTGIPLKTNWVEKRRPFVLVNSLQSQDKGFSTKTIETTTDTTSGVI